ncbi:helix-turn-helix domain-containing protein [Nocardiopsis sp. HNM0947]|uniref:Helix-turn-helix domain-containing protein n=1 Tax=Nocardiopsis coralli TaxID=2772213 RepID=A0ABR9P105_9ACTN|nr:helix-turn-helix domain-containing protein [Nocardiopsis coralli]MBE2997517.1 helix-turn-helix domain-containing protein [Nocardiopsis coralli]
MTPANDIVARNVQLLREQRGLSLAELARRAGVAKQTVSKLELGTGNPTVDTLHALSQALEVPLTRLLAAPAQLVMVQRDGEAHWNRDEGHSSRELDHIYGSGMIENYLLRVETGQEIIIEPHPPGTLEHLYVIEGPVQVGPADEPIDLAPGDFARYPGDRTHVFRTLGQPCVMHLVVSVPRSHPGSATPASRSTRGSHRLADHVQGEEH